jgi:hypothetical protein
MPVLLRQIPTVPVAAEQLVELGAEVRGTVVSKECGQTVVEAKAPRFAREHGSQGDELVVVVRHVFAREYQARNRILL